MWRRTPSVLGRRHGLAAGRDEAAQRAAPVPPALLGQEHGPEPVGAPATGQRAPPHGAGVVGDVVEVRPGPGVAGLLERGDDAAEGSALVRGEVRALADLAGRLARRRAVSGDDADVLQPQQERLPLRLDAVGVVAGCLAGPAAGQPGAEGDRRDGEDREEDDDRGSPRSRR